MENILDWEKSQLVCKANDLVQKSRYSLSAEEQKIILYLISKIKPTDSEFEWYEIDIKHICELCGIEYNGKNYYYLRETIKKLHDKSFYIPIEDKNGNKMWTLCAWVQKAKFPINPSFGGAIKAQIRFDEDMRPYLLQLKNCYTKYELKYALSMRSKYGIRIYEILKSHENMHSVEFSLDDLKSRLNMADTNYTFANFRIKVLEIAKKEINEKTDINISYSPTKTGRAVTGITFEIKSKK